MKSDYLELLKRAHEKFPPELLKKGRFALPVFQSHIQGMRTTIRNFNEVAQGLRRDPQQLLKFLSKEMATAATTEGGRAIFQGKFPNDTLQRLLERYAERFVKCPVCGSYDTKIVKERRLFFLTCEACGARSSVPTV
ncbi:MAG TPA: translation initiation factor IF-2 subunit beta [Candidatus Krumholzibacteriaceae bacterium]|nr:translation initiation factor IF-2 subunit beta [Candidatus Krumholzibacteriaceae bacterium]